MSTNVVISTQYIKKDFYRNRENAAITGGATGGGYNGGSGNLEDYYTQDQVNTLLDQKSDIVGTPVDNQLAIWTGATGIEGNANLTYDGDLNLVSGALAFTGAAVMPVASVGLDASNFMWVVGGSAGLKLTDDGANGITILDGGNVVINNTSTTFKFDVNGTGRFTGDLRIDDKLFINNGIDISPSGTPTGQLIITGNGYGSYVTLDGTAMYIGHNSSLRGLVLQTDETDRLVINGTGLSTFTGALQGDSTLTITGISTFTDDLVQPDFTTGFQGSNWQIEANGNAEFNDLLVRGSMSVYELIINQLRYQDGGLIIGAGGGKIKTVEDLAVGDEILTFEDPEGNSIIPFTVGAIVLVQDFDLDRTTVIKKIVREVSGITAGQVELQVTTGWATGDDTGIYVAGDTVVAIGHVSDTNLDSVLYMSAVDSGNPFLRIMDGVTSYSKWSLSDKTTVKVQLGNLASLASYDTVPASPGYGLYSDNVYLTGKIVATSGEIGGWVVDADSIKDVAGTVGLSSAITGGDDVRFFAGHTTPSSAPFNVTEAGVLTATSGTIGGWVLGADSIEDTAGLVGLSSAVTGGDDVRFWAGHATPSSAPFYVTEAGVLKAASGTIGGWTIDADSLYVGTKRTSDGYTAAGITLDSDGNIRTEVFYTTDAGFFYTSQLVITNTLKMGSSPYHQGRKTITTGTEATAEGTSVPFDYDVLQWTGAGVNLTLDQTGLQNGKIFTVMNSGSATIFVFYNGANLGAIPVGRCASLAFSVDDGDWFFPV